MLIILTALSGNVMWSSVLQVYKDSAQDNNKGTTCALLEASMARYRNLHHGVVKPWVVCNSVKRKDPTYSRTHKNGWLE